MIQIKIGDVSNRQLVSYVTSVSITSRLFYTSISNVASLFYEYQCLFNNVSEQVLLHLCVCLRRAGFVSRAMHFFLRPIPVLIKLIQGLINLRPITMNEYAAECVSITAFRSEQVLLHLCVCLRRASFVSRAMRFSLSPELNFPNQTPKALLPYFPRQTIDRQMSSSVTSRQIC